MWPWDHVAIAYVLYSIGRRLGGGRPGKEAIVLGIAALMPDAVDKTLSWGLQLMPAGYSIGHSIFVAIPLGILALVAGRRRGQLAAPVAFVVGYWSHLAGDVVWGVVVYGTLAINRVLWPVVELQPYQTRRGLFDRGLYYLADLVARLVAAEPAIVVAYLAPMALAMVLWLLDGTPGLPRPGTLKPE